MANEVIIVIKATDKASKVLGGIQQKTSSLGKALGKLAVAGGAAAIAGIGVALTKGTLSAISFEKQMAEVRTLLSKDFPTQSFDKLNKDIISLSKEMGIATSEMIPALYQAISAGVPPKNVIEFLRTGAKVAVGGVSDLTTSIDGLTTITNAWKISTGQASRVADMMFTGVKLGKTTIAELSRSMFQAGPIAASMGVGVDHVIAAVASLTKQGTPTAVAMTQIRQSMVSLQKPNKDMAKLLKATGFATGEALFAAEGYAGGLDILTTAAGGNKDMLAKAFGSVEALQAVMGLAGENAAGAAADYDLVTNAVGASDEAFATMNKTVSRQWDILKNKLNVVLLELGQRVLPIVLSNLARFSIFIKNDVLPILKLMAAGVRDISAALVGFGSWLVGNKAVLIAAIAAIGAAFVWTNPVILAIVGAGGVIFALGLFREDLDKLSKPLLEVRKKMRLFVLGELNFAKVTLQVIDAVTSFGASLLPGFVTPIGRAIKKMEEWRQGAIADINAIDQELLGLVRKANIVGPAFDSIAEASARSWRISQAAASEGGEGISTAVRLTTEALKEIPPAAGAATAAVNLLAIAEREAAEATRFAAEARRAGIDVLRTEFLANIVTTMKGPYLEAGKSLVGFMGAGAFDQLPPTVQEMVSKMGALLAQGLATEPLIAQFGEKLMGLIRDGTIRGSPEVVGAVASLAARLKSIMEEAAEDTKGAWLESLREVGQAAIRMGAVAGESLANFNRRINQQGSGSRPGSTRSREHEEGRQAAERLALLSTELRAAQERFGVSRAASDPQSIISLHQAGAISQAARNVLLPLVQEIRSIQRRAEEGGAFGSGLASLASGGIVRKPTLALVGEKGPEAVVPLGRGQGVGNTLIVNINGPILGLQRLKQEIVGIVAQAAREGGFRAVLVTPP